MIEQLHCIQCERDFTGTPQTMVFKFTEHDCFTAAVEDKQQSINNHPTSRNKETKK